ncbi:hypothetical protein OOK39_21755 [Streptomyces sp. NBC_00264]|uniref:hypothetical protein n=1 Tax=unclassified Streptomyces TaxID=2593676 RepID=UPI002256A72D|nr:MULTISPECIES: hypothetical protein [unclassified Streptomyces]MCX5161864.1 hypothetical protein [Streptomyces sp. NBC_00305]MCX5220387.1 hypothetical protein [Streptomyces sp. NBC_00264]
MPYVPQDVLDRLANLEREVAQLRGRAQIRPAMNQILNGDVVVGEGGQLIAKTPGGQRTFIVGQTPDGDWGVGLGRENGTAALTVGDDVNAADAQMIRIWSRDGEVIVMDDAYSDGFLGRPSIPIPMQPTSGRETSSTTETTAWTGATRLMNSVIYASFETYTPAGVTADVSFEDSDGVIESWVANTSNGWTTREITKPVRQTFFDHVNYRLKHSVRSGTGAIRTNVLGIYTRNAFTPAEAP